ncbi:MAG: hypothetical protein AAGC74_14640, partial [Verrucomicrobiota bacterium]
MKKFLFLLIAVLILAVFAWWHFSAPRVVQRRCDSMLSHLNFGLVSLDSPEKEADQFASHLSNEVRFLGAAFDIIEGTESRNELRDRFIQFRQYVKSSSVSRVNETQVTIQSPTQALLETTIDFNFTFHGNSSTRQT